MATQFVGGNRISAMTASRMTVSTMMVYKSKNLFITLIVFVVPARVELTYLDYESRVLTVKLRDLV